ncbi:MAG: BatD family protein [Prevotellaceae bacterium]|nr:BatD family protein [Prevotellaceae bacterium]
MKKILLLWIAWTAVCLQATADDKVSFTISAPEVVVVGDQFRLSYKVTTQDVRDFRAPASITGFDILAGPYDSRETSMVSINGVSTSESSITYNYTLMATAEGDFTIPAATIMAGGKQLISNSAKIKVLPADKAGSAGSGAAGGNSRQGGSGQSARSDASIGNDELFVTATASKTSLYEQEAFVLTYKIYVAAINLRALDPKLPDFKGFQSQEVERPNDLRWTLEHYKGRNYQTAVYFQYVLFPQQSGKLTIDPARFEATITRPVATPDPFDFFNGGSNYVAVKKVLMTPKITLDVKPLPDGKPAGFSGGVGNFDISSTINANTVKTNDAVTVKVVISGTGNMKLLGNPEMRFPEEFEVYDPKVENKFRLTSGGLTGSKVIEYLAIPRNAGTFKIPGVTFSYFDLKSKSYKTLTTEEYTLNVEKGKGNATETIANFTNKEELKVLNEDIRFIKQNKVTLTPRGSFFFASLTYWLLYLVPALLFLLFFAGYRKQIAANANVVKMRTKKANKVAVRRLKQAGKLLSENKKDAFYDEVLKALWGYISDKLNIPLSRLSKDNIEEELRKYGASDEVIREFIAALNNCEFARFAPGDDNQAMDKVYAESLAIIGKIEN